MCDNYSDLAQTLLDIIRIIVGRIFLCFRGNYYDMLSLNLTSMFTARHPSVPLSKNIRCFG